MRDSADRHVAHWSKELDWLDPVQEAIFARLALGLTRGALSARLGPLEADGLITRTHDAVDHRRVHVRLTAAGYEAFEQHAGSADSAESALLSALTADEKQTLADLLRKLVITIEPAQNPSR
jgi:DNA-binding MarR family transcriptional regulator